VDGIDQIDGTITMKRSDSNKQASTKRGEGRERKETAQRFPTLSILDAYVELDSVS
jgi:hypothetical protein